MNQKPNDPSDLSAKLQHAQRLITALCDDQISAQEFHELDLLVCTDPEVRQFYVEMMHLDAGLYYFASAIPDLHPTSRIDQEENDDPHMLGMSETMMLPALRDSDFGEESDEIALPGPVSPPPPAAKSAYPHLIKGGIAAAVTIGLGLAAYFLPMMGAPAVNQYGAAIPRSTWYVAWTGLSASPVWEIPPQHGESFAVGDSLVLQSGAVQLKLRHNGQVVVEGPADVSFISDTELRVNRGRIVATFPGGGLTVQCPAGSILDLGTQFGVAVDATVGSTEVEVFQGSVAVTLSSNSATQPVKPLVLTVGQAAEMQQDTLKKSAEGAIPQRFICSLKNDQVDSLDVTDLLSGGDGTTRRRGIAIDAITGAIGPMPPVLLRMGDRSFHRIAGYPVIDGAFVPQGDKGPTAVDSAGDLFQFPITTNGCSNYIWTGGEIPWGDQLGISTVLGGVDYSTPEHAIICTHCNNAVTIDLDVVRRLHHDRALTGFHSHFGNSYINGFKGAVKMNPVANIYVLMDGKSRYEKKNFSNQDGPFSIDIPISRTDRYMTLAAVDDGKDIDRDWILWTDAKLDLSQGK